MAHQLMKLLLSKLLPVVLVVLACMLTITSPVGVLSTGVLPPLTGQSGSHTHHSQHKKSKDLLLEYATPIKINRAPSPAV